MNANRPTFRTTRLLTLDGVPWTRDLRSHPRRPVAARQSLQRTPVRPSVNVLPACGTNLKSYDVAWSVSLSTPNVVALRTWLFALMLRERAAVPRRRSRRRTRGCRARVAIAVRLLAREPLVVVVVAVDDHVGAGRVERPPERLDLRMVAVGAGAEQRVVPVRGDAARRVRGQVRLQPLELRRARAAAADRRAVRVEGVDPPRAEVVGVPALARLARRRSEVREIAQGIERLVLVVAGARSGSVPERAPRGLVAVLEVTKRARRVGVVTCREHRAGDVLDQVRRLRVAGVLASRDVPSPDEYRIRRSAERPNRGDRDARVDGGQRHPGPEDGEGRGDGEGASPHAREPTPCPGAPPKGR